MACVFSHLPWLESKCICVCRGMHLGLAYWWALSSVTTLLLSIILHNKLDTWKRALPSALGGCLGLLMGLFSSVLVVHPVLAPKTP